MILKKINELLPEVVEKTGVEPEIVAQIVRHQFTFLRGFLDEPNKAALVLPELGTVYVVKSQLYIVLKDLARKIRKYPDNEFLKELFRAL